MALLDSTNEISVWKNSTLSPSSTLVIDPTIGDVGIVGTLIAGRVATTFLCLPNIFLQYPNSTKCLKTQASLTANPSKQSIDLAVRMGATHALLGRETFLKTWKPLLSEKFMESGLHLVYLDEIFAVVDLKMFLTRGTDAMNDSSDMADKLSNMKINS